MPFSRVLVANRGEIAARVLRTLRRLQIEGIAVYSEADAAGSWLSLSAQQHAIGPARASESYLAIDKMIEVAKQSGAEAVHPGYGFLSENARFAEACAAAGLVFVGPKPETLRLFGDKSRARAIAKSVGVPTIPGSEGAVGEDEAMAIAAEIGFPVMVKAAGGGGGMGMEVASDEASLRQAIGRCRSRGLAAFGDDRVYLEKAIVQPKHIEVQVLFDKQGSGVALGERECSMQRRYQKVIEETPSPALAGRDELRQQLFAAALAVMKAGSYEGAGTVEFLLAQDGSFYFIEVNARLQVEHPVTEWVTGLDLVAEQLALAAGRPLSEAVRSARPSGYSIECRIYAEDPKKLLPKPGTVTRYVAPEAEGLRVDDWIRDGSVVSPFYDPLVAKFATVGSSRE